MAIFISIFIATVLVLSMLTSSQIVLCEIGCAACQTNNRLICNACAKGYQLSTLQRCIKPYPNTFCSLHSVNQLICQQCHPTFRVSNGTCRKDYSGCVNYNVKNVCTKCDFGKILVNNGCIGTLNCKAQNSSSCTQCSSNYILSKRVCFNNQKVCIKIDFSSGACMQCLPAFRLVGFQCIPTNITSENCNLYDSSGICRYCKIGFLLYKDACIIVPKCSKEEYLSMQYTCQKLPDKCASINLLTLQCQKCNPNFQLNNLSCIANLPDNCLELNFNGQCKQCLQRYFSFNFTCKAVSRYCKTYSSTGNCINCIIDYFINFKGFCKDPFCLNMNERLCQKCRQHYRFDNQTGKCLLVDSNCKNLSEIKCQQCFVGFYISSSVCQPLPENCLAAKSNGSCNNCSAHFYLQLGQCFLINRTIEHCRQYSQISSISKCLICELGFMVSLGKCIEIPPFCTLVLSNGKCAMCNNGYQLKSSKCQRGNGTLIDINCLNDQNKRCVRCSSNSVLGINGICYARQLNQCQQIDMEGDCLQCKKGSILSNNQCVLGVFIDLNCRAYNKEICNECYAGYYLNQNKCNLPNYNCSRFNTSNGGCIQCYSGYILTNFQCIIQTKIPNCISYDSFGNCVQCARMFYIQGNTCLQVNFLCQNYNPFSGHCTSCFPGYQLEDKQCAKNNKLYWDKLTNLTVVCKLKKGSICIECPGRYYLRDNVCILVNGNCQNYNSNGNCLSCTLGSFLINYNCLSYGSLSGADPNCRIFESELKCIQCYNGHIVIEDRCQIVNPLCMTFDSKSGDCQSCYDGYSVVNKSCYFSGEQTEINPCLLVDRDNKCLSCIITYYISNGTCKYNQSIIISTFNIPFCKIGYNSTYCQICDQGFYPRQGNCYQVSIYCKDYHPLTGKCLSCKEEYIFQNNQCIFPALGKDQLCQTYSGAYCSRCKSGNYLKEYICRKIDSFCVNFNIDINQCLVCSKGQPIFDICS